MFVRFILAALVFLGACSRPVPPPPAPPTTRPSGVPTAVPGVVAITVPPVRPAPIDLTVRNGGPGCYSWYQGHTADQAESDGEELSRIGVRFPEAVLAARAAGASTAAQQAVGQMQRLFRDLLPVYITRTLLPNGAWHIPNNLSEYGHYYNFEAVALTDLRTGLLAVPARCAVALTSDLAIVLNIGVSNGKCSGPNPGAVRVNPPPTQWSPTIAAADPMQAATAMPPLTPAQQALVVATMQAHEGNTACRCTQGPCPGGDVFGSHLALEASATSGQRHALMIPPFSGATDPVWTHGTSASEECRFAQLTERFHHAWATALLANQAGSAYANGIYHLMAHVCLNIGSDPRLLVRFPCTGQDIANCPVQTCRQAIGE